MNLRTPLSNVRGLGSAKEGTDHFWKQRVTAIANVVLISFMVFSLITHVGADYQTVKAYLSSPIVAVLMMMLVLSGIAHMRLGMQVVIEDYVHSEGRKIVLLLLNNFFSLFVGLICIYAVLKLSFGA